MEPVKYADRWESRSGFFRLTWVSISGIALSIFAVSLLLLIVHVREPERSAAVDLVRKTAPHRAFVTPLPSLIPVPPYLAGISSGPWRRYLRPSHFNRSQTEIGSDCSLCGTRYRNFSANSSSRDLVLTMATTGAANSGTFVRTLRSTGCKATIVVFIDSKFRWSLTEEQESLFQACRVDFVKLGQLLIPFDESMFIGRHYLFYDFLKEFRSFFDRVIIVDMTDTIFQMDPFTTDFGYYTMGVTSEIVSLNQDPTRNSKWIKVADPEYALNASFYDRLPALNAGFVFGSMEGFLIYYNVFLKQDFASKWDHRTFDQGYLNYLYYKGHFEKAGLHLRVTYPGDYLVSVRGGRFDRGLTSEGLFRMEGEAKAPAVIHQYNKICPVMIRLKRICKALPFDRAPFPVMTDVSQDCEPKDEIAVGLDNNNETG
jgi:hypothetical protein